MAVMGTPHHGTAHAWTWGEPATLASVCRDAVEITLAQRADARPPGPSRACLRLTGIESYYAQIERAGARIVVPIGNRHYGLRDFRVADPDGNELDIGRFTAGGTSMRTNLLQGLHQFLYRERLVDQPPDAEIVKLVSFPLVDQPARDDDAHIR